MCAEIIHVLCTKSLEASRLAQMRVEAALGRGLPIVCVVLMQQEAPDLSSINNAELIRMHLPEIDDFKGVFEFPWLGAGANDPAFIEINLKKLEGVLGVIFKECILPRLE